jgi:H+-transporting ATPase
VLALVAAVILSLFLLMQQESIFEILTLDLSIVIAGIPISLPTVMTLIISVGISRLAKEGIVTRKISSLENLANVNLLLTDKTGTLTEDKIKVVGLHPAGDLDEAKMLIYAEVANTNDEGGISTALAEEIAGRDITLPEHDIKDFIPHDSERKRSTAHGQYADQEMVFSLGAPQVVLDLCTLSEAEKERIEGEVENYAANGYRALALSFATGDKEEGMTFGGVILFSDTLRRDAAATIRFMRQHGVAVKMVTGDNHAIAARVAEELAMDGKVWSRGKHEIELAKLPRAEFTATAVFAEVLPAEKYELVEQAKKHYAVAVTGDGVNDIPPVRAADVGIAVKSAVDALKQAADIVINRSGLHVITKAILEARNIFARLTAYSVYRISESVRVIFSLLVLALLYTTLPIQPIQLILLALVNDIPIISLAFNRTEPSQLPSVLHSKQKFVLGSVFGALGLLSSILFVIIARSWLSLDWAVIQTLFFLKLSVSGHLLIYVAHTKHRWWKYLPSRPVIVATTLTQMFASLIAFFGFLMAPISLGLIGFVWLWSLLWMQVSELAKFLEPGLERELQRDVARARHDVRAVIH